MYLHGSRHIAFVLPLPSGGLRELARGSVRRDPDDAPLYPATGGAETEKLRDKWMTAMVAAL